MWVEVLIDDVLEGFSLFGVIRGYFLVFKVGIRKVFVRFIVKRREGRTICSGEWDVRLFKGALGKVLDT